MTIDARGTAPRRVVVETNVFELCELKTLAWRVYGVQNPSDPSAAASTGHLDDGVHGAAFARFADAVCSPPAALTAWQAPADEQDDPLLWVFSVNISQPLPTEAAAASVRVVSEGTWSCESDDDASASDLSEFKPWLFRALYAWLAKRLLAHGQFRVDGQFFCLAEAKFVFRRPSLSRVRHFDVFLDEAVAASGMAFHFELLPSHWLCVAVEMVHQDSAVASVSSEISGLATAWRRTLGIPHERDHAMVDVWHQDDLLVARVVAETKYDGIFPRFRAFPRRRKGGVGSGNDQGGGGHGDDSKADTHENEGDDDNHSANDADDDSATRGRNGGALGKKKRRKPGANEAAENDESIIPVSPDPHVNSPDASGPVVGMTFPRDRPLLFHMDHEIHVFKRRRRKKNEPSMGSLAKPTSLSFGLLLVPPGAKLMPPLLRGRSTSQSSLSGALTKPETPKTPPPSLGASLAASLTHVDEREALDHGGRSKPLKIHPLLQALDDYVAEEMAAAAQSKHDPPMTSSAMACVTLVPNAPGFSPSADEKKKMKVISRSYDQQLQSQLLSDRFTRFLTGYYPRDLRRNKRQQRRERDRKILLEFDETKLLAYGGPAPAPETSVRDQEIAIGIHLAALDALVPWRLHGKANSRWTPYGSSSSSMRAADTRDTLTLVHHVTPHLTELQAIVKEKNGGGDSNNTSDDEGEVHDPWMTLERYCAETRDGADTTDDVMQATRIERVPLLCVATAESSVQVEIPAISEFTLRGFQPVAAPKPIDFAIVCPHSPSEWLGTLTLSYVAMFKSLYAQSAMGDQVALDLSPVASSASVHVDVANATMLVECATASGDAFATYRAAGEMLRPLLSQGVKKKQAFARSAVANVVYIVAPFGRSDIKHKLWLLGAFARGLFGEQEGEQGDWRKTVTLELLYLEDLIAVGIDADPFALLPAAMALYDRIFERVALQPIAGSGADATTRFVCERLYHLSDTKPTSESAAQPAIVHAGFSVSSDGKWLLTAFTDALGAVLETRAIAVAGGDLSTALVSLVELALQFVALMGESARLAIAQLLPSSSSTVAPVDAESWHALALDELQSRFALVVPSIVIYQASFLEKERVQVRPTASTLVMANDHDGVLVIKPEDATVLPERSRVANTKWLCSTQRASQETSVLRVQLVHTIPVSDSEAATSSSRDMLEDLLTHWVSLSYLTTHPIALQRQSPLPLHLAAVDELHSELELLEMQLTTDPLALRR